MEVASAHRVRTHPVIASRGRRAGVTPDETHSKSRRTFHNASSYACPDDVPSLRLTGTCTRDRRLESGARRYPTLAPGTGCRSLMSSYRLRPCEPSSTHCQNVRTDPCNDDQDGQGNRHPAPGDPFLRSALCQPGCPSFVDIDGRARGSGDRCHICGGWRPASCDDGLTMHVGGGCQWHGPSAGACVLRQRQRTP